MRLSIVICTRNRAETLKQTLAELLPHLAGKAEQAELLVVANDVSDDTLEVCRAAGVRCIEEAKRGLGHARNTSIAVTRGAAILWLDDDVSLEPGCLETYLDALETFTDDAFFGGPIRPNFQGNPPNWITSALEVIPNAWAGLDLGPADRAFDSQRNEYPYGANMVIRRSALVIPFRADIGRNGRKTLVGGEESVLFRALKHRGLSGRWVAGAAVRHRIDPERQTLGYIRQYFIGQGIQSVILNDVGTGKATRTTLHGTLRVAGRWLRYIRHRMSAKPEVWLRAYADLYVQVGRQTAGSFQRSRSAEMTGDNR